MCPGGGAASRVVLLMSPGILFTAGVTLDFSTAGKGKS